GCQACRGPLRWDHSSRGGAGRRPLAGSAAFLMMNPVGPRTGGPPVTTAAARLLDPEGGCADGPCPTAEPGAGRPCRPAGAPASDRRARPGDEHEADAGPLAGRPARLHALVRPLRRRVRLPRQAVGHAVRPRHLQPDRLPDLLDLLPPLAQRRRRGPRRPVPRRARPRPRRVRPTAGPRRQRRQRRAVRPAGPPPGAGAAGDADGVRRPDGGEEPFQERPVGRSRRLPGPLPEGEGMSGCNLAGRVAFITGAAHGQGRATALALAREGVSVAALDVARPLAYPGYTLG